MKTPTMAQGSLKPALLKETLINVAEAASARQKQAIKRSLCVINEHFERVFNAAMAMQVINQNFLKQWRDDIACVFERDPAARTHFEVLTTYPGVHALLVHRISHRLWQRDFKYTARLLSFWARCFSNVDIHPGARIGERFFIDHGACVVIGETAEIGNNVTLYHGVTLGGTSWRKGKRHPTLLDGVLVGAGAKILGPITIGAQARVGANSVVVNDVPAACTVVGIPGKVVKVREAGTLNQHGFDLDHHLIPDPVGRALTCLLSRMDSLEQRLLDDSAIKHATGNVGLENQSNCIPDNEICVNDCIGLR